MQKKNSGIDFFEKSDILNWRKWNSLQIAEGTGDTMNEVIEKLYEIEENAVNIMNNAGRFKEECRKQTEEAQKKFEEELERETAERLEKSKRSLDSEAQARIRELEDTYQKQIEALEETYTVHLEELSEDIFRRIAGGA